jgi:proteic killer suppression protein
MRKLCANTARTTRPRACKETACVFSFQGYALDVVTKVVLTAHVQKLLRKLPEQIRQKLLDWATAVQADGLAAIRKIPGYHDEPIKVGPHAGQRSIRLNRAWRAFYVAGVNGDIELVSVEDINKHTYDR